MIKKTFIDPDEEREAANFFAYALAVIPVSSMIFSGKIDPEKISREDFMDVVIGLCSSKADSLESHATYVEEEVGVVAHCLDTNNHRSAIVLLFTLIESELNKIIRIVLRIRGFSSNKISDALRGVDFNTKLDVILPLLDIKLNEKMRNTALQCKSIRNIIVHNKATPTVWTMEGPIDGDEEVAQARAEKFFLENPLSRIRDDIKIFDDALHQNSMVQAATMLFAKYIGYPVLNDK